MSPSVVTVSVVTPRRRVLEFSPFGGLQQRIEGGSSQDIGTGFIVSEDGLIVTNKHVVSEDGVKYKVITQDDKEYDVTSINRDPSNDIAVIKISASGLKPLKLGDSNNLKVGQFVIAIGTALGEFRHTVTTGVISGLGRGITAGNPYEGFVEELDNVIQTDAAINPGNSGGPLLNSSGEVIGVNVAVAQGAQNIGFAIPINVVKNGLTTFKSTGKFAAKPYLGVQYQMISRQTAVLNDIPQGAYITDVVGGSAAEKAGVEVDDIVTEINGQSVSDNKEGLGDVLSNFKPGDKIKIKVWRNGEFSDFEATLQESNQ
jgi:serine protease Do